MLDTVLNGYCWDSSKAVTNLKKHGVSFEEAVTVFRDPNHIVYGDQVHHERFVTIGYSRSERVLFVVACEAAGDLIRIISARKASAGQARQYEGY